MDDIFKLKIREQLSLIEKGENKRLQEGCAGGVCSVGGGSSSSKGKNNGGTKISSLNSTVGRLNSWDSETKNDAPDDEKENILPESPNTEYIDQKEGIPFTAEEKYVDDWTAKELKFENKIRTDNDGMGHQLSDLKERYSQMMEGLLNNEDEVEGDPQYAQLSAPIMGQEQNTEIDPAHQTAEDLGAVNDEENLYAVKKHFSDKGTPVEIMVTVNGTSKSVQEWANEIERDSTSELKPEVPDLGPEEGGDDGSIGGEGAIPVAFPEIEPKTF